MSESTIRAALRRAAESWPDAPFLAYVEEDGGLTASRAQLLERSQRVAAGLQDLGVESGDRVASTLENGPEILEVFIASALLGAIWVPTSTELPAPAVAQLLSETSPRVWVVATAYEAIANDALRSGGESARVVLVGPSTGSGALGYTDLAGSGSDLRESSLDKASPASIQYTSGTTGRSKGIVMPNGQMLAMGRTAQLAMSYGVDDVLYGCLPLYHGNAFFQQFLPAFEAGSRVSFAKRFSASRFWKDVHDTEATRLSLLGSMIPILWNRPEGPYDSAHRASIALVIPRHPQYQDRFDARFHVASTELYGLTDAGPVIGVPPGTTSPAGSCGQLVSWWDAELVDEQDRPVAAGRPGELILRPREKFITQLGYWQQPEATVSAWRNLWFHTGDLLRVDANGWYYFVDRNKDAIRRFGENVSAYEVEVALTSHDEVVDAAAYGVESDLAEQEVMAAVVLKAERRPNIEQDLIAHCSRLLPYFAVPRYLEFLDALPLTATAKVQKSDLRQRGVTPTAWDRGPTGKKRGQAWQ